MQASAKKERTRKQKALRRLALLLIMMVFASAAGLYGFFPAQGRLYNEETHHTGRTQLVQRLYDPSIKATKMALFDLTKNKNVTMLHCVRWHPLVGWMDSSAAVIDCSSDAPLYSGSFFLSDNGSEILLFVFGRVDEPSIVSIKISLQKSSYLQEEQREIWTEYKSYTLAAQNWKVKDGARYFVESIDMQKEDRDSPTRIMISAYDENGIELSSGEVTQYTWTSLG